MVSDEFQEELLRSRELTQAGRHREAVAVLENLLGSTTSPNERVIASQVAWGIFAEKVLGARPPSPGSADYQTFHKLLQAADDAYPSASPEIRSKFDDADKRFNLRAMLEKAQRGLPLFGDHQPEGGGSAEEQYEAAKSSFGKSILAWVVIIAVVVAAIVVCAGAGALAQ